jgi:cell division protein FtsI (penicillin-binding protein 3)
MDIKRSIIIRVRVAFLCVVVFALFIAARIGHIQIVEGDKWRKMGEEVTFQWKKVKPTRGNIYSDNGSLLATSLPFYRVAFDATLPSEGVFRKGIDSLAMLLSRHFGDRSERGYRELLLDARSSRKQYVILNRKQIDHHTKKQMMDWPVFREGRYKGGVIFEKSEIRYRPFSNLSRRTIGFVNENGKGAGLEFSFDHALGGVDGEAMFQKIGGGNWKPVFDANNKKAVDGFDIQTTIDVNLQDVAETSLHRAMAAHEADEGTVVVMEVKTGEVRAISNLKREGTGYAESFNHAVRGMYEPGSTFKLVTMIALLEETSVSINDMINTGNGVTTFYGIPVRDHHEGGFGKITVQGSFEQSSNIAMARLADQHFGSSPKRFLEYVDELRMSRPLGLQIAGEEMPRITRPTDKAWSGITLPWMSHGYGFEITPLHTLAMYNAVANDGKMIKPIFVRSVMQADEEVQRFETEIINPKICSQKTLNELRILLEGVVERGTAKNLKNAHYRIAGKTGTSQVFEHGRYTSKWITSFVGYFPAHAPKYSAIVLIKNPKGPLQTGNSVAGPVFREIADNIYSRDLELHPLMAVNRVKEQGVFPTIRAGRQEDLAELCNELGISNHSTTEEEWIRAARNGNAITWKKNAVVRGQVPDVTGMTFRDAIYLLEKEGLSVDHSGKGRVISQSITPGSRFSKGSRINIKLAL